MDITKEKSQQIAVICIYFYLYRTKQEERNGREKTQSNSFLLPRVNIFFKKAMNYFVKIISGLLVIIKPRK